MNPKGKDVKYFLNKTYIEAKLQLCHTQTKARKFKSESYKPSSIQGIILEYLDVCSLKFWCYCHKLIILRPTGCRGTDIQVSAFDFHWVSLQNCFHVSLTTLYALRVSTLDMHIYFWLLFKAHSNLSFIYFWPYIYFDNQEQILSKMSENKCSKIISYLSEIYEWNAKSFAHISWGPSKTTES